MNTNLNVKICGMRDAGNILKVAEMGPEYMGFIFYPDTPRYVGDNFLMPDNLDPEIKKTGVFVNEKVETILRRAKQYNLSAVQLHGDETAAEASEIRKAGVEVIKVFRVDDNFDFEQTVPYKAHVDFFMFDTKGKKYGGNAVRFNWNTLDRYDQSVPFFLSGGLTPEDIQEIVSRADWNLYAVDLNSGVEEFPGYKDLRKVNAAISNIKAANELLKK